MAQPIPLEIPPRNPRAELRSRWSKLRKNMPKPCWPAWSPQELHNRGVLEIMRGAFGGERRDSGEDRRQCQNAGGHSRHQKSPLSGAKFLEASSPNGSRGYSRQFPKESLSNRRAR